jgi:dihydrofolate synthase/folylpolyglutamate synthase
MIAAPGVSPGCAFDVRPPPVTSIATYDDALAAIWARSGYDRGFINNPFAGDDAARLGLLRTRAVLDELRNPEDSLTIVHVAGSKGKGSTCQMIDAILRAAGVRSGRFLSPHLHSYRERFVVDDELIPETDFADLTQRVIAAAVKVEDSQPELGEVTAFELSTSMALTWFADQACDVAVIEVGLGGTLDATNVVNPAVSTITTLDYEHTAILGSTLSEIASNKAGIIKPGRPVFSAAQPADASQVIEEQARAAGSPLYVSGRDWQVAGTDTDFVFSSVWGDIPRLTTSLAGMHQVQNAGLAIASLMELGSVHSELAIDEIAIRRGLDMARHPGRFEEVVLPSGQTVVIDGAHTPASAAALAQTMNEQYPNANTVVVVGMFSDKDISRVLAPLRTCAGRWIAVEPDNPRSIPVDDIRAALEAMDVRCERATTVNSGIREALASASDVVLVTGSLATAAEARVALGLATADKRS